MTPLPVVPPHPGPDDEPFWEAATNHRLVLPRCLSCGTFIWYPRRFCPDCHRADVEWIEASGLGTVYSYTVSHRGIGPWSEHVPYVIAYVELLEGPCVLTNIVGADPDRLRIGEPVRAVFQPAGVTKVLRFEPVDRQSLSSSAARRSALRRASTTTSSTART